MFKFTIIIPHHNIPTLLERCVNSIPQRDDVQVVVVDDNSDGNELYLRKYSFLRRDNLLFVPTKEGRGAGYARNVGLKHAKGEWLVFADSDDFFVDGFLDLLDKYSETRADVVYFNIKSVFSDDITKEGSRNNAKQKLFDDYRDSKDENIFRLNYPEPWGKMVKHTLVKEHGVKFDETRVANDYYFSTQVGCLAKAIEIVDEPLYVVTVRRDSLSFGYGDTVEKLLIRLDVGVRVYHFRKKYGYCVTPMPMRGQMVLLLKHHPFTFLRELFILPFKGVPVLPLIQQIFSKKYMKR